MMARRGFLGMLAGGAASLLSGCGSSSSRYRQRMIVEVETPSGLKIGSSVIEVGQKQKPKAFEHIPGNGFSARGEAVAVDIAPGKVLFALLAPPPEQGSDIDWYQARLFGDAIRAGALPQPPLSLPGDGFGIDAHKAIGRSEASIVLPAQLYPLLVTFDDINDPTSVKRVDPADLAESFGAGVRLKRIVVEVTGDDVTDGIVKRLNWLFDKKRKRFDRSAQPIGIPLANYDSLFSTEALK